MRPHLNGEKAFRERMRYRDAGEILLIEMEKMVCAELLSAEKVVFSTKESCTLCGTGKYKPKEKRWIELPVPYSELSPPLTVLIKSKMCRDCTLYSYWFVNAYRDPRLFPIGEDGEHFRCENGEDCEDYHCPCPLPIWNH